MVEGNYLLLDEPPWDSLAPLFDLTAFIDVDEAKVRLRLERRWADMGDEQRQQQIDGNDLPNVRLVLSASRPADVVVQSNL